MQVIRNHGRWTDKTGQLDHKLNRLNDGLLNFKFMVTSNHAYRWEQYKYNHVDY